MRKSFQLTGFAVFWLFLGISLAAQEDTSRFNYEEAFKTAQSLAWDGKYKEARTLCDRILDRVEGDYDTRFLLAKINSWDKKYQEARELYYALIKITPDSKEVIHGLIDTENWAGDYPAATGWIRYGLDRYPGDPDLAYKQAVIYQRTGELAKAQELIAELLTRYPDRKEFKNLYQTSKGPVRINGASAEYTYNHYKLPVERTWNMIGLKYYKSNKIGTFIGGFNTGYFGNDTTRFMENAGVQFEIDAYPVIPGKKRSYHFNLGLSPSSNFARQKAGAHIYNGFGKGWELEAGFNFMRFRNASDTVKVLIADAGLSKYFGDYIGGAAVSFSPIDGKVAMGVNLTVRKYFSNPEDWLQLSLGYGIFPDNPLYYLNDPNYVPNQLLASYNILLAARYQMSERWIGRVYAGYQYEEYRFDQFRHNLTLNLALIYLFRNSADRKN